MALGVIRPQWVGKLCLGQHPMMLWLVSWHIYEFLVQKTSTLKKILQPLRMVNKHMLKVINSVWPSFPCFTGSAMLLLSKIGLKIILLKLLPGPHLPRANKLTHWSRVMHISISKLTIIGSDNGLSPGRRQASIWTNDGILLIGPLGTNFSEIFNEIYTFSFKKMHLKMSSGKCRPFCLSLNVLMAKNFVVNMVSPMSLVSSKVMCLLAVC